MRHMVRFLALICTPSRLASYIVTVNVSALYLALHYDQDRLYNRAEDSGVVGAILNDGVPHLISALVPVQFAAQESLSGGMRPGRALASLEKPEDCAHVKETRRKSLNLSHLIDKRA